MDDTCDECHKEAIEAALFLREDFRRSVSDPAVDHAILVRRYQIAHLTIDTRPGHEPSPQWSLEKAFSPDRSQNLNPPPPPVCVFILLLAAPPPDQYKKQLRDRCLAIGWSRRRGFKQASHRAAGVISARAGDTGGGPSGD